MMDHHCTVTNNCVGSKNMRFFIQFTAWASFGLIVSLTILITLFYTQNSEKGVGATKLTDLIILNPITAFKQMLTVASGIFNGNLPASEKLKMIDGILLLMISGALAFASSNGISVIKNLRNQQTVPMKLK